MIESDNNSKVKFLAGWIGVNLLGWILGVASGFCLGQFYLVPIVSLSFQSPIVSALSSLFIWFPLGAWIGAMQLAILKKWKIQSFLWVIYNALGWSIPATMLSWYYEKVFVKQFGYSSVYGYWFYGFGILLVGTSIGFAQTLLMRNIIRKRFLWVLANALGLLLCVVLFLAVLVSVIYLLPPESEMGGYFFGFVTWTVTLLTLPFVGSIPALGTGLILLKYGINNKSNLNTDELLLDNTLNQQSKLGENKSIGIGQAILIGQLVVNIPVLIIILSVSAIDIWIYLSLSYKISVSGLIIPILIGVAVGWLWWSFSVPRWRQWALKNGAAESELQKWAVITGLVWPKGSIFEKTEFKAKE